MPELLSILRPSMFKSIATVPIYLSLSSLIGEAMLEIIIFGLLLK